MYLLFDIGGTKTRLALSQDEKTIEREVVISTPRDFQEGVALIAKIAKERKKVRGKDSSR